jgi:hypothetical protein
MHWFLEGLLDHEVVEDSVEELAIVDFLALATRLTMMSIENSL